MSFKFCFISTFCVLLTFDANAQRLQCSAGDSEFIELIQKSISEKSGSYWLGSSAMTSNLDDRFSGSQLLIAEILDANGIHQGNGIWMINNDIKDSLKIFSAGDGAGFYSSFSSISIDEQVLQYESGELNRLRTCFKEFDVPAEDFGSESN